MTDVHCVSGRRAASATLCTSLTTMVAFFSNALSPLLGIQSFGLFSGVLVFVNYLSVIVFFPTVIIFYHRHWESWTWPCFRSDTSVRHVVFRANRQSGGGVIRIQKLSSLRPPPSARPLRGEPRPYRMFSP